MANWIAVERQLPPDVDRVLIARARSFATIGCCLGTRWMSNGELVKDVTHWMPLPDLPKEKE